MLLFVFLNCAVVLSAFESRVFNGKALRPEMHGYLVDLDIQYNTVGAKCSGSIVDENWIITSAHCLKMPVEDILVLNGAVNDTEVLGIVEPYNIVMHPEYVVNNTSLENRQNDMALLKVSMPIRFNKHVWPIDLARCSPKIGELAIISGYGDTGLKQFHPREGPVVISECPYADLQLLCSSARVRAGDGDSGGALTSRKRLVGVTSASCVGAHLPEVKACVTIYASVAANFDWIESVIGKRLNRIRDGKKWNI